MTAAHPAAAFASRAAAAAPSDALVVFGFTGDLANKKILPALYAMVRRGTLNVPVIGVASSNLDADAVQARVRSSVAARPSRCCTASASRFEEATPITGTFSVPRRTIA